MLNPFCGQYKESLIQYSSSEVKENKFSDQNMDFVKTFVCVFLNLQLQTPSAHVQILLESWLTTA